MSDPNSRWYANKDTNGADDLLLFANNSGSVVVTENRGKVLEYIGRIPEDIDGQLEAIQSNCKNIRARCLQVIAALLTDDEPSQNFIADYKSKYSVEFWDSIIGMSPINKIYSIAKFHGVEAAFEFACRQTLDEAFLENMKIYVLASINIDKWRKFVIDQDGEPLDESKEEVKKVLDAIRRGLNSVN